MSQPEPMDYTPLKEAAEKATPGPWGLEWVYCDAGVNDGSHLEWTPPPSIKKDECGWCGNNELVRSYKNKNGESYHCHRWKRNDNRWHDITSESGVSITGNYDCEDGGVCSKREDADYIALANPTTILALLRRLEAASKVIKSADDICDRLDVDNLTTQTVYAEYKRLRAAYDDLTKEGG